LSTKEAAAVAWVFSLISFNTDTHEEPLNSVMAWYWVKEVLVCHLVTDIL
jgi:hypothetical protein